MTHLPVFVLLLRAQHGDRRAHGIVVQESDGVLLHPQFPRGQVFRHGGLHHLPMGTVAVLAEEIGELDDKGGGRFGP